MPTEQRLFETLTPGGFRWSMARIRGIERQATVLKATERRGFPGESASMIVTLDSASIRVPECLRP
ncbi:hypothetical protein BBP40_008139 [Aspergillus hancockii]|nr:hypothetical protein BBP40_008139 [Aspergillus hancockii]